MNEIINKKKKKGFTLLETIIALSLLSIGGFAVFNLIANTKGNMSLMSSKLQAAYLAQEGIEIIRNIRDTNWLEISSKGATITWDDGLTGCEGSIDCASTDGCSVNYDTPTTTTPNLEPYNGQFLKLLDDEAQTKFQRKIIINALTTNPDVLEVSVIVCWKEKNKNSSFSVKENLYNWLKNE